jgi:phosphatidylserine/phosphatidylglycerophosphate/cardiolipin synthase-like enzyme
MMWLLMATGFMGAFTLLFLVRMAGQWLGFSSGARAYHSPKGGCTDAIIREIKKARREILMLAYSFTAKPVAEALLEAKGRGVHIEILLDRSNEQETCTELSFMIEQGLVPQIDAQHAMAHNKVILIDGRTLITGSFDFTAQAEAENAENVLILRGRADLVQAYRDNFMEHKSHCQAPKMKPAPNVKQLAA